MTKHIIDLYGGAAANYVARPHYPEALFRWLAEQSPAHDTAWDCACGSGQASHDLAKYFDRIIATDASSSQIRIAVPSPKIFFNQAAAEVSGLPSQSIDLINVGMAAHWFDLPAFYKEARRVAKPDAVIALLVYGEPEIAEEQVNDRVKQFMACMNRYRLPEHELVETLYRDLPFVFADSELQMPKLHMEADMTMPQMMQYFRSRSKVINYTENEGRDPVRVLENILSELCAIPDEPLKIKWPLSGRVARIG